LIRKHDLTNSPLVLNLSIEEQISLPLFAGNLSHLPHNEVELIPAEKDRRGMEPNPFYWHDLAAKSN
jgi:hypothetical protein